MYGFTAAYQLYYKKIRKTEVLRTDRVRECRSYKLLDHSACY